MQDLPVRRPAEGGGASAFIGPRGLGSGGFGVRASGRFVAIGFGLLVLVYSVAVMLMVALMGDIGVRCIFNVDLKEPVSDVYAWDGERPRQGDQIRAIGAVSIRNYADYVKALRSLSPQVNKTVPVSWEDATTGAVKSSTVEVRYRPSATYIWSVLWFGLEMVIFLIGARVFWKRPGDESAEIFFWLCAFNVGAYMGGFHWTEIVTEPWLIYPFAAFAVFLPVVTLHFYLVFPRTNPILAARPWLVRGALYGPPSAYLAAIWGTMFWSKWLSDQGRHEGVLVALGWLKWLALGYVGLASLVFILCVWCLYESFRRAATRSERNQVQWIFLAALVSVVLIGYLLAQAATDPATLGRDSSAWPMFGVSLLFTLAYAVSITRYKLMQVEPIIKRSVVSVLISVSAGLFYSAVLLLSGVVFREQLLSGNPTWRGAMVFGLTYVLVLTLSELARGRFQKAIDRRFYREKYKFDQAMRKMNVAVGSLVDRDTLGRRLLEAAGEVLRLEWGAVYLRDSAGEPLRLAACHGPTPDDRSIAPDNPLVGRLGQVAAVRVTHAAALAGSFDAATDAMIALGGEAATGLQADGELAGLLVLGPKRSGMPYEDEEIAFLGALSSVATLALHSAEIQQTLETLNQELRDKVEKIAEQQRRILLLQDQLTDPAGQGRGAESHEHEHEHEHEDDRSRGRDDGRRGPEEFRRGAAALASPSVFDRIKGSGRAVRQMIETARKVADSTSAVLIRGESGTGKELLAEAIHAASPRAARPFVKVHCAALSQTLLESELFGHVKGAFTGADRDRIGRFEQANGGTLFLDEIGDINLEVQTKLLRVLQEMAFERVGSSQTLRVDVRVLAATHQDLEALIAAGRFREDLYYRLNVISLRTPSLRERRDDVFELAVHFLRRHAQRSGKAVTHLDEGAVEALESHDWPGNVRELENVIERAVVLADGPAVTRDDLPPEVRRPSRRRFRPAVAVTAGGPVPAARSGTAAAPSARPRPDREPAEPGWQAQGEPTGDVWDAEFLAFERQRLLDALEDAAGNKSEAARLLGMPRSTFCSKLKKHGIG